MTAYYNEFDPFAAAWLRELIKDGLIADGVVDERSIADVRPEDLEGFTQCHFFAGIGGWSAAARLAKWDDDRPMWTGSPPCQPFSTAGNRKGQDDLRHLWPVFFNLIRERRPPVVFGEQVAAAIRTGWFDDLQTDMEAEGYATAMVVLPACSVGAPHKRERLWTVAAREYDPVQYTSDCDPDGEGWCRTRDIDPNYCDCFGPTQDGVEYIEINGELYARFDRLDNSEHAGLEGYSRPNDSSGRWSHSNRPNAKAGLSVDWGECYYPRFRDGKCRPVPTEPALFPLAHGISNRVGVLRGAGNAIVPQVAAEIIGAYMDGI